jgi:FkbM family methyltransferase
MNTMELLRKLVRGYTFYSPIDKGKYRLSEAVIKFSGKIGDELPVKTKDDRNMLFPPTNAGYRFVYFIGEYEPAISNIFRKLVKPGDVCFDIGANVGWFTTLFQKLTGSTGAVHAFEPIPKTFELLSKNAARNKTSDKIFLNNTALGDVETQIDLHIFPDLPDGHASISTFGHENFEIFHCPMITLDSYLEEKRVENVNFVKIDIEGAELMMLKGAAKLFEQKMPPVFEIEMALATSKGFGYVPNDLIEFMKSKADFDFYAIDETNGKISPLSGFKPDDIGANVLCLPKNFDLTPLKKIITEVRA